MATRIEMILGAKDESGPALDNYGRKVKQTFQQAGQDAQEAARGTGLLDAATGGLVNTFKLAGAALGLYGGFQLADLAKNAVILAARYETLGATLNNLGKNAGYSASFLEAQETALRKTGISAIGARDSLARMMQANLDLSKASQLARVAQDAAAVAGINSTEAYQHLVYGIQSAQVEMLRTVGLNVSFEQSYAAVAAQTGRTADSLGEAEKAQIRLNAVLEAGKNIAGTYEAAMGTAGKQMLSFARYWEDMQVELGKAFGPALTSIIEHATLSMKGFTETVASSTIQGGLGLIGDSLAFVVRNLDSMTFALGMAGAAWLVYRTEMMVATVAANAASLGMTTLESGIYGLYKGIHSLYTGSKSLWALMAANPWTTAAAGLAIVVTGSYALINAFSTSKEEISGFARELRTAETAVIDKQRAIRDMEKALYDFDKGLIQANGNAARERELVEALAQKYPTLVGNYNSIAQAIDNVNQRRGLMLAQLDLEKAKESAKVLAQAQKLIDESNKGGFIEDWSHIQWTEQERYWQATDSQVQDAIDRIDKYRAAWLTVAAIDPSSDKIPKLQEAEQRIANQLRMLTQQTGEHKLSLVQLDLINKVLEAVGRKTADTATEARKAAEAFGDIDLNRGVFFPMRGTVGGAPADLTFESIKSQNAALQEQALDIAAAWDQQYKLRLEARKQGMSPGEIAREEALQEYQAYGNTFMEYWPGLAAQIRDYKLAEANKTIAAERTAEIKGLVEIGAASREALIQSIQARAAILAGGNAKDRAEAIQLQGEITKLYLDGVQQRQAIVQANVNLGREGQGALVAAYQAELNLLPLLKLSSEERAKRELELILKIRDAERSRIDTLQEIESLKVSWMEEGAAKEAASLEASLKRERRALEQKIQDDKDYQADAQSLRAQFDAHADRQRDKQALKEKQSGLEIAAQTARLAGDSRRAKELELEKYILSLKHSGYTELEQAQLIANKRVEIHQTGLERMLLEQADFYEGWDKIGENALSGIQSDLVSVFKAAAQDIDTIWTGLWESAQNIALQAFAAIAARLATYGLSNLILAVMPSLGGALGPLAGGTDAVGSALSLASLGNSAVNAYNWFANGGLSTLGSFGNYGGFGSSLFSWGPGATGATAGGWEMATPLQANGLSGLGYAVSGIGGALTGWQLAQMLYGNGVGGQIGGALGGAGGGIGGAMLGTMIMPGIGTVLGGLLGGLGGGALGGGLGSLFDSEDNRLPYEIPGNHAAHYEELSSRVKDYTKALKDGTVNQEKFLDEVGKMAPLAAGSGDYLAGYGGIIGGTIEKLSGLSAGTEEYARVVRDELNPAWIISKGLADDLANGMSELDARKKALSNSIDALAASSGLDEEQQGQLIDLIISQSGSVADLTAKYERYNEIKAQLANAHTMERGQVEALAAELRGLHDELGIQDDPMTNLTEVAGDLNETLSGLDATLRSIMGLPDSKTIDITVNEKHNKDTYHSGGMVRAALTAGLITRHGGGEVPLYAHEGLNLGWPALQPGEVDIRALVGEWVINRQAVDYYGQDFMAAVNAMRVPVVRASEAARQVSAPAATSQGSQGGGGYPPVIFQNCTFGSNHEDVARVVRREFRPFLADMNERGEQPGNSDSMGVTW